MPITLSFVAERTKYMEFACRKCDRRGRYAVARLFARYGNVDMSQLFDLVVGASCEKRRPNQHIYDLCGLHSPTLSAIQPPAK